MAERVRRGLQTVTNLGQFTRREIDALLLHIRARPLTELLGDLDMARLPRDARVVE